MEQSSIFDLDRRPLEIVCAADFHGFLPKIRPADVLVIAGDTLPFVNAPTHSEIVHKQLRFAEKKLSPWIEKTLKIVDRIVIVGGNYDYPFAYQMLDFPENCIYLEDESWDYTGVSFYGFPWCRMSNSKKIAFTLPEKIISRKAQSIPDTDILIAHSPPFGFGDTTAKGNQKGLPELTKVLLNKNIRHMVCGHIHNGHGKYDFEGTEIHSVSITELDSKKNEYKLKNKRIQRFTI